jgi:predicted nuclease of predicted toxin-antitoxin system
MKIIVDENIPLMTVQVLRDSGHDVLDIRGTKNEGMKNSNLWKLIQKEHRFFITTDKGFTEYRDTNHYGILIICLRQPNRDKIHDKILLALKHNKEEIWNNLLVVMRDDFQSEYKSQIKNDKKLEEK